MNHESGIVMCIFGELTAVTGSDKTPWPWMHDTCTPWKREWMNFQNLNFCLSLLRFWTMTVSFKCLSLCVASGSSDGSYTVTGATDWKQRCIETKVADRKKGILPRHGSTAAQCCRTSREGAQQDLYNIGLSAGKSQLLKAPCTRQRGFMPAPVHSNRLLRIS